MVQGGERSNFFVGIDQENGQLQTLLLQLSIQFLFLEAPAFPAQAFYAVTVYGAGKMAGRGAKAYLYGIFAGR